VRVSLHRQITDWNETGVSWTYNSGNTAPPIISPNCAFCQHAYRELACNCQGLQTGLWDTHNFSREHLIAKGALL
jgi:hypothetical protein